MKPPKKRPAPGRPPIPEENLRVQISCYVTHEQKEALKAKAKEAGFAELSPWMVKTLLEA